MTITTKRLLYLLFFLIFFVVTPILILYATGYRYNFKKNVLEKTGILIVESQPKNADVYLNGKSVGTTPHRLTRLLPDHYTLEVRLEGHQAWQREIEINSNRTTFYRDIVLFKNSLPIIVAAGAINLTSGSPDRQTLLYSALADPNQETIHLLDLESQRDQSLAPVTITNGQSLQLVSWSPSGDRALIRHQRNGFNLYLVVDRQSGQAQELFDFTRINFDQVNWDQNSDSRLYGLEKSALYQIDLNRQTVQNILAAHLTDFQVRGDDVYYITEIAGESFLNYGQLADLETTTQRIKLPSPSDYRLKTSPADWLVLLDAGNHDLFIIKRAAFSQADLEQALILQAKATKIGWSPNQEKLWYLNDFELWVFDTASGQATLINRFGQPIGSALWYPGNAYLLYATPTDLRVTEATTGAKNDVALVAIKKSGELILDASGKNVYFVTTIGNQRGLYQLTLQ